jgi:hypothetical protein
MDDALLNCLTGACCPPGARQAALTKYLSQFMPEQYAAIAATQVLTNVDLAPKGTMQPLIQEVARLARGADYRP